MRDYSLSTKVTISFGLCIFLLFISLLTFSKFDNEREIERFKARHFQAVNYLATLYQNNVPPDDLDIYFRNFGLNTVLNDDLFNAVLNNGLVVFQRPSNLGMVSMYQYNQKYYLFLENNLNKRSLLESSAKLPNSQHEVWFFIILFVLLTWTYFSTLTSIAPLKSLRQVVRKFAYGDLNVECKSDRQDEIGELSNEFDKAIGTIRDLITSRQLFLRTIMHELKTPIGKGRIISELITDDIQKERLRGVFLRMEVLIDGLSKMEQILSKNYNLKKQDYEVRTLLESAFDIMFFDPEQLHEKVRLNIGKKSVHINVDINIMTLAFKNLIDNAIKYSSDNKVTITLKNKIIYFSNKGEPLQRDIGELMQAFVTTSQKTNSNEQSLGLGLYIVESILKMHNLRLNYKYEDGYHFFYIDLNKISKI